MFVDLIMARQSDDPLALIPTIDDDSDVLDLDGQDEDDEEEMEKPRPHKLVKGKSMDFNEEFQFLLVGID